MIENTPNSNTQRLAKGKLTNTLGNQFTKLITTDGKNNKNDKNGRIRLMITVANNRTYANEKIGTMTIFAGIEYSEKLLK